MGEVTPSTPKTDRARSFLGGAHYYFLSKAHYDVCSPHWKLGPALRTASTKRGQRSRVSWKALAEDDRKRNNEGDAANREAELPGTMWWTKAMEGQDEKGYPRWMDLRVRHASEFF